MGLWPFYELNVTGQFHIIVFIKSDEEPKINRIFNRIEKLFQKSHFVENMEVSKFIELILGEGYEEPIYPTSKPDFKFAELK